MSWEVKSEWEVLGAGASLIALLLLGYEVIIAPWWRRRRLKHPCIASFNIREEEHRRVSYAVQDDKAHRVEELILPSNKTVEIEVAYRALTHFSVSETVLNIEGEKEDKPEPMARLSPFIDRGKKEYEPEKDSTDIVDIKGNYHFNSRFNARSENSWFVAGFRLRTKKPGRYKVTIGFIPMSWMHHRMS